MAYLLIIYMPAGGILPASNLIAMQRLDSKEQCEAVAAHIKAVGDTPTSRFECMPLPKASTEAKG